MELIEKFLEPTYFLEVQSDSTKKLISDIDRTLSPKNQAIQLFYKIRDSFIYDPYHLDLRSNSLRSDVILQKKRAWCVEKSIVLATGLRALGIPSKLGYGIVTNHLGVEKLQSYLRREEIVFHGYVSAYLDGKWIKTTPAFDRGICRIAKVNPLDWDGEQDALLQEYQGDRKFMEYNHFYGDFADVPLELMKSEMQNYYPHLFEKEYNTKQFSFLVD